MKLTVGKDWKLRNEQGDVVGSVEPGLELVIDVRVVGAEKGERGTGGGSLLASKDDGLAGHDDSTTDLEQGTLDLPSELRAGGRARDKPDLEAEVWEHYVSVMRPRNVALDRQTRGVIREALKVATLDECKLAINSCEASDFHMKRPGSGNDRRKFNSISHILKGKRGQRTTREQIDFFLDLAEKSGVQSGLPSGDPARINGAKQDIRDAHEMPGDEHVVTRGKASEDYLTMLGWKINRDETGWPTFEAPTA